MTYRILITGSRDWDNKDAINTALYAAVQDIRYRAGGHTKKEEFVLVSGACPTGADKLCEEWAKAVGITVERHPANWDDCKPDCDPDHRRTRNGKSYCPAAGFTRNLKMVDLGATVCVAFIKNKSNGATMTANLAQQSGIPVKRMLQ